MMDIKYIREHADAVKQAAKDKRFDVDIDRLLSLDDDRRRLLQETESIRARRNEIAAAIPKADNDDRPALIDEGRELKERVATLDDELAEVHSKYRELLLMVPNIPLSEVPVGDDEEDNRVIRHVGEPREFDFEPKSHEELGEYLDIIDKERAIRMAGSRSYALKGAGALLEFAIMRLAIDIMVEREFTPVVGPLMVNREAMVGTGFFPYGEDDTYHVEKDEKYLVGTSEVFLVSLHRDEILDSASLPLCYAGYSPCFRREAGSAGRDVRGVYRVHQFTKVEQVILCEADPEKSREMHELLLSNSEELMKRLELPYRVAVACTGETGLGQVLKNEIETWMPSREKYSETHSCSSLYDYQARRSGIRYRDESGETVHCYTLNNTMAASPRLLIPILEHYQNEDGTVDVPEALKPYMYGMDVIEPPA